MKRLTIFAIVLASISPLTGEDFISVEPGSFPRGHTYGRYGGLARNFPLAIEPQFYGDSELPGHYAFITTPFQIATTEVTVGQFREFVKATGYKTKAEKNGKGIVGWSPSEYGEAEKAPEWNAPRHDFLQKPEFTWNNPGFPQSDDHPVVGVSWQDAQAYCAWRTKKEGRTYRLPTEAEWEMVARAGTGNQFFFWGDELQGRIQDFANIGNVELEKARSLAARRHWLLDVENDPEDGHVFTAPVGSYQPNAWKVHDMSGNVFEWCQDIFDFNFYDQWKPETGPNPVAVDPQNVSGKNEGGSELRVIRGGSWYTGPLAARSSARAWYDEGEGAAYIGFRVVREATKEEVEEAGRPYEDYLENIQKIEAAGGSFRPENGKATLSFRSNVVSPEVVEAIAAIPGLSRIRDLRMEPWSPESWQTISSKENLENFTVHGDGVAALDFSTLSRQSRLTDFQVSSPGLTDENLRQMSGVSSLQRIYLSNNCSKLTDEGMKSFAGNKKLLQLAVYDCTLTGTFIEAYKENPYLLSLWIGYVEGEEGDPKGWTAAGSRTLVETRAGLMQLTLQKQPMQDDALEPLHKLFRLEELDLSYCGNLSDAGIARLLENVATVEKVGLLRTQAGEDCVALIPQLNYLQSLTLEGTNLNDESFEFLSRGKCLHELSLRHGDADQAAKFTAAGFARLGDNPTLRKLEMESHVILGAEISGLAASSSLEEITLPLESFTDDLVEVIAHIPSMKKVSIRTRNDEGYNSWKSKLEAKKPGLLINRR